MNNQKVEVECYGGGLMERASVNFIAGHDDVPLTTVHVGSVESQWFATLVAADAVNYWSDASDAAS